MRDFLIALGVATAAVITVVGVDVGLGSIVGDAQCTSYGAITEREVRYSFTAGCFAKDKDGQYRYWSEFKRVDGDLK